MHNALNNIIKYSIYVLVFLLPLFFLPFSFEAYEFNKQYLLFFLVSIAFFAWIARMTIYDKEIRFRRTPPDIPVLVFLFAAILSAVFSVDKFSSLLGFYGRFSDGLIGLLSLGALYFLITNNTGIRNYESGIRDEKEKEIPNSYFLIHTSSLIKTFFWSSFFVILMSYFSIFGVWAKIPGLSRMTWPRIFNPVSGSMEGLSVFLAVVIVFVVGFMLTGIRNYESGIRERKKGGIIHNSLFIILLVAAVLLMIIIDFRAAWIVLGLTLLLFIVFALRMRIFKENVNKLLLPILLVLVSVFFLASSPFKTQNYAGLRGITNLPQEQVLDQGTSWGVGFRAATDNIKSGFLGSGIGTFYYDFSKFKSEEINQTNFWQFRFNRAGNHIAELIATMGILGILSYLMLAGLFLMISWFIISELRIRNQELGKANKSIIHNSSFIIPLSLTFVALIVGQFVYYQNITLAFTFWLVLAFSVVSWQKPIKEKVVSFKSFPELSLVFTSLIIILGLTIAGTYFFGAKFYLADTYYKKAARGEEPIKNLEKAVNLNPNMAYYRIVLARLYLQGALQELAKPVAEQDENTLAGHVQLAINYAKGGEIAYIDETGRTKTVYIKGATELAPNLVFAWETAGIVYRDIRGVAKGALEWGIKSFEKAITLETANPALHTELGKLYLIKGETNRAKTEFEKARALKPDYADALIQTAIMLEGEGNLTKAIETMESLAQNYPLDTGILFQLGRLYYNNNQTNEAISQFKDVVSLFPNHSNAHYSLGMAYLKKGEKNLAIFHFERVLELNPGNQGVLQKLEELKRE